MGATILPESEQEVVAAIQSATMKLVHVAYAICERRLDESRRNALCEGVGECLEESTVKRGIEKHRPR